MATHKPLVIINGQVQQLPLGDFISGGNVSSSELSVLPSNTEIVDVLDLESKSVKWSIICTTVGGKHHQFEISAHKMGSIAYFSKYAIVGSKLQIVFDVNVVDSKLSCSLENNEQESVSVHYQRYDLR